MKKILFVASTLFIAGQVQAGPITPCTQANLNGSYVVYNAAVNSQTLNHNGRCEININAGVLSGTCVFGTNSSGQPGYNGPVHGTAVMNTNCSADVTMGFDPVPGVVHIDSNFDLQFSPNKESFVGSFGNNFGVQGVTNGTRFNPQLPSTPAQ
ncbi:hypothetical protein IVG45_13300 [Methylomonas sp. LL1]|uniref:hypothetical protein n=1 Tax=Methylomonas sp. LL1 TaxID=2785785 RepID=UPI0018C3C4A6|nr:hypothetical protein [Methylomonas sp. LL1]QPK61839.1 hypothetical protein IVG45_13300 [Methylomonas sp. LL1]